MSQTTNTYCTQTPTVPNPNPNPNPTVPPSNKLNQINSSSSHKHPRAYTCIHTRTLGLGACAKGIERIRATKVPRTNAHTHTRPYPHPYPWVGLFEDNQQEKKRKSLEVARETVKANKKQRQLLTEWHVDGLLVDFHEAFHRQCRVQPASPVLGSVRDDVS